MTNLTPSLDQPVDTSTKLQEAIRKLQEAETVFLLAGAGLSAEMGIQTYWEGSDSSYGSQETVHGYTALQHSDANLWMSDTASQIEYFSEKYKTFAAVDITKGVYRELLDILVNKDYFCLTSNVDSAFYYHGFDSNKMYEVHGSYRKSQCLIDPLHGVYDTAENGIGLCPICTMPTRPNALFFNDYAFNPEISFHQQEAFNRFLETEESKNSKTVILELGVGSTIPRLRQTGNRLYRDLKTADYIHVNIEEKPEFLFGESCDSTGEEIWVQSGAAKFLDSYRNNA